LVEETTIQMAIPTAIQMAITRAAADGEQADVPWVVEEVVEVDDLEEETVDMGIEILVGTDEIQVSEAAEVLMDQAAVAVAAEVVVSVE